MQRWHVKGVSARLRPAVARFRREDDGAMIIFGLYILVAMMIVSGLAFDLMRFETERLRTQSALDRSVLAAAALNQPLGGKAVVESYFEKANLDSSGVTVTEDRGLNFRIVSAESRVEVPTRFMRMVDRTMLVGQLSKDLAIHDGVFTLGSGAGATAEQRVPNVEVSLVLDVSGSMNSRTSSGNTRIHDLRNAAREFSNLMLCDPQANVNGTGNCSVEPGTVSISLIPYAEQAAADETLIDAIDDPDLSRYDITDEHDTSACITFDEQDFSSRAFSVSNTVKRTGHFDPWSGSGSSGASNWTCKFEDWRRIRPFVGHHSNLNWMIGNLRAGGNTSIDVGMKWAVSLLDPEMRPVIGSLSNLDRRGGAPQNEPDFPDRPTEYNDRETLKAVVIMSDGENTDQHFLRSDVRDGLSQFWMNTEVPGAYSVRLDDNNYFWTHEWRWEDHPFGAGDISQEVCGWQFIRNRWRWICETETISEPGDAVQMTYPQLFAEVNTNFYERFSWLPDPVDRVRGNDKDDRLHDICETAKTAGIVVFAIGFDAPSGGREVLRDCASSINHYYDASGLNLSDVFVSIASAINNLKLTQ